MSEQKENNDNTFMENITKNYLFLEKNALLTGIAAIVFYFIGFMVSGYFNYVGSGDPTKITDAFVLSGSDQLVIAILTIIYSFFLIYFGLVLYAQFTTIRQSRLTISGIIIIILGFLSFILGFTPNNFSNSQGSFVNSLFMFLIILNFIIRLAIMLITGYYSKEIFETNAFLIISIVLAVLTIFTGAIGFFLVWLGLFSYLLYNMREK